MTNKLLLILSLCVFVLNSCVTPRQTNYLQDIPKDYPEATNLINSDYRIIPGDQLSLKIYTLDDIMKELVSTYIRTTSAAREGATTSYGGGSNPGTLNVYSDGTIKIPYLGQIYVQDLTILEAKKVIEERFLTFSPNLTIELALQNRYFSVLGEAGQRRIDMPTLKINIFQALALSGPIGTFGDRTRVKLVRQTPNGTEVKVFDIRSKDIVDSEYYYIEPNDVIYVSKMNRTFFGSVTSFGGMLGLFGIVTSTVAIAVYLINLTK